MTISRFFPLSVLLTVAITWASLTSWFPETPLQDVPFYDKWAHFVMYGVLSLTVQFECRWKRRSLAWWMVCGVFPCMWGVLMEVAQATLTDYRSGDILDALANALGVALGLIVGLAICAFASCRTQGRS